MDDKKELLIVKKERFRDKLHVKVTHEAVNRWADSKYLKIVPNKDYNHMACLLFDLHKMGYNIPKAYDKFKKLLGEPDDSFF